MIDLQFGQYRLIFRVLSPDFGVIVS